MVLDGSRLVESLRILWGYGAPPQAFQVPIHETPPPPRRALAGEELVNPLPHKLRTLWGSWAVAGDGAVDRVAEVGVLR